jgi:hypothetical protein
MVAKVSTIKRKMKQGKKLGASERAQAKARGLIKRADGTKRKSPKYKRK